MDQHDPPDVADASGRICQAIFDRTTLVVVDCTHTFARLLGYSTTQELAGRVMLDLIAPESFEAFDHLARQPEAMQSAVCVLPKRDGGEAVVAMAITPVDTADSTDTLRIVCIPVADQRAELANLKGEVTNLSTQNERLKELTNLANHDLRNLLQAVVSTADLMELHWRNGEESKIPELTQRIRVSADAMKELLSSVMKYVRFEVGEYPMELIDLNAMVDKIGREATDERGRTIVINRVDTLPPITCEPPLIRELFLNLIGNAIKYSVQDPVEVEVGVRDSDRQAPTFYVKDHGVGIAPADLPKVFEPFTRADRLELNAHGSGMGMALSQKIVARHGGEISLKSVEGRGTTVIFSLGEATCPAPG